MPKRGKRALHSVQIRAAEHDAAAAATVTRSPATIADVAWAKRKVHASKWDKMCEATFGNMARCAYCGVCALGGKPQHWVYEEAAALPGDGAAPAARAAPAALVSDAEENTALASDGEESAELPGGEAVAEQSDDEELAEQSGDEEPATVANNSRLDLPIFGIANSYARHGTTKKDAPNKWLVCGQCKKVKRWAHEHVVFMDPDYAELVLRCRPEERQLLSLVDVKVDLARRMSGVLGTVRDVCLFDGPLFRHSDSPPGPPSPWLQQLFDININNNPLLELYLTCMEMDHPASGYPIISAAAVAGIVKRNREREVRPEAEEETPAEMQRKLQRLRHVLGALVEPEADLRRVTQTSAGRNPFLVGEQHLRATGSLTYRVAALRVNLAGQRAAEQGVDAAVSGTSESALFPYLFPNGYGFYLGRGGFAEYVKRRVTALFTPFTLDPAYVLMMAQANRTRLILQDSNEVGLRKDLEHRRQAHPDESLQESVRHVMKTAIPGNVEGSPQYWRDQLLDLKALVAKYGMPQLFLTLTVDDTSTLKWREYRDIEGFARLYNSAFVSADAPVEGALLFEKRCEQFMNKYVRCGKKGILGVVERDVGRKEMQNRLAPHAHYVLWLHPDCHDRVKDEIVACIPAERDASGQWIPPTDPQGLRLFKQVLAKQIHDCSPEVCCKEGHCARYFPYETHAGSTTFDPGAQRFLYYRPRYEDRNVVPYHPTVLLLWNAHICALWVTDTMWSTYLLKYTVKGDALGPIVIDTGVTSSLGLQHIGANEARLLDALVYSQPWSVCEAAWHLAGVPLVTMSEKVLRVNSQPPKQRKLYYTKGAANINVHPVERYIHRPAELEDCTFTNFYRKYLVSKTRAQRGVKRDVGIAAVGKVNFYVQEREEEAVVRFSDPHPGRSCEAFFYNILLDTVPFRSEDHLITNVVNKTRTFHEECCLRGMGDGPELERRLEAYHQRHMHDKELLQHSLLAIQHHYAAAVDGSHVDPNDEAAMRDAAAALLAALPPPRELFPDQRAASDAILANPYGLHVLIGGPGTGKSYVVEDVCNALLRSGRSILKCATSGIAATRLSNANTVHSTFRIGIDRRQYFSTGLDPTGDDTLRLRATNVAVIDEFMMMDCNVMAAVVARLNGACVSKLPNAWLKERLLILVGDDMQLPPVCSCKGRPQHDGNDEDEALYACDECHLGKSPHMQHAIIHRLRVSVRHSADPGLAAFLSIIEHRLPSQHEINECFGALVLPAAKWDEFMDQPGARSIHAMRIPAQRLALARLNREFSPSLSLIKYAHVEVVTNLDQVRATGVEVPPKVAAWATDPKFHQLTAVAVGAQVLLTATLDADSKAVNGASGVVVMLKYNNNLLLQAIDVRLDSTNEVVKVYRTKSKYWNLHGSTKVKRSTFPLMLGYSMTAHKAQGGTFDCPTLIDPTGVFCPGQLYVMVSRNPSRKNMRFTALPKPRDFRVRRVFPEVGPAPAV